MEFLEVLIYRKPKNSSHRDQNLEEMISRCSGVQRRFRHICPTSKKLFCQMHWVFVIIFIGSRILVDGLKMLMVTALSFMMKAVITISFLLSTQENTFV
jgi:hypothetical protein